MFITSDQRFADKYKAVAYKMQIPIDIKVYDYKNKVFKSEEKVYQNEWNYANDSIIMITN